MTTQVYPILGRPLVPENLQDEEQHRKALARAVDLALRGQLNCTMQVTLTAGGTTTTIFDPRLSVQTAVILVPLTAHAAAEVAAGALYVVPAAGTAVINHINNAQTDRTFITALIG